MKNFLTLLCLMVCTVAMAQTTYYSRNAGSGGDWNLNTSWTLSSDGTGAAAGPPGRTDHIVILNGHTITVDAINDNGSAGTSADAQYTVGTFPGYNANKFYQTGNIDINSGGILDVTVGSMFAGIIRIDGELITSTDLIIAGYFELRAGSTLGCGDDFILIDVAEVVLDNNSISSDDIYLDGTSAQLCGSGDLTINGAIQEYNGADANQQVCNGFTINCSDGNCCDDGTTVTGCAGNGDDGSFGGSGNFTLPVDLISFSAKSSSNGVELQWATASELNNSHFTIEKSLDGISFDVLATIVGNGTISSISEYSYKDFGATASLITYRLSQSDFDGTTEILGHEIVSARVVSIAVFPNPASSELKIMGLSQGDISIIDVSGRIVFKSQISLDETIDVSNWKNGIYMVNWSDISGNSGSQLFSVKH